MKQFATGTFLILIASIVLILLAFFRIEKYIVISITLPMLIIGIILQIRAVFAEKRKLNIKQKLLENDNYK